MDGQVAHPLQVRDHAQGRHQDPKVAGDGRLPGKDVEALVLDPLAGAVDGQIAVDDRLCTSGIALQE